MNKKPLDTHNLRSMKKNELIRYIRKLETAIKLHCYECMGGQKRLDCELTHCHLYQHRPWTKNKRREK